MTPQDPSSPIAAAAARRRTFAIISHPDAGKTTLTEKLLLFGGAIHLAGEVKAKGGLIHSALVIRVSAHLPEFIEVLEKQDPAVALATRTIAEIRDHYAAKHRGTAVTTEIRFYRCPPARQA